LHHITSHHSTLQHLRMVGVVSRRWYVLVLGFEFVMFVVVCAVLDVLFNCWCCQNVWLSLLVGS